MIESMNINYMGKTVCFNGKIGQIIGISQENYIVRFGDNLPESIPSKQLEFADE